MSVEAWLLLAVAAMLMPIGEPVAERVHELIERGRLPAPRTHAGSGRARRRAPAVAPPAVVGGAIGLGVAVAAGPVLAVAAAVATATGAHIVAAALRRRVAERAAAQARAAIALLAAELEAGSAPGAALRGAAGAAPSYAEAFHAAAAAMDVGGDPSTAFEASPELWRLGHAWSVAATTGTPLGDVLSRLSADLAARAEAHSAVTSALAAPRSSAAVLALLPLLGVGLGAAMGARPLVFLLEDPIGRLVCLAGVMLDVLGVLWTRQLAAVAERP